MRKIRIGIIAILIAAAIVRFAGVTVSTLILFVIAAFTGGFILGRRRRVNNR